ncbi:MAG TPA: FtsX-like permease family protein [Terriglobales bacterium]|nr:FtsX-like permease family protein [Terriglobales bacterium]
MFIHLLKRGLLGRGNRPLIAFTALAVASTMIAAMLSLYYGLDSKLNRDFRSYGANVTIAAADGVSLPEGSVRKAESVLPSGSLVVPFAFVIAHSMDGSAVVVSGTDLSRLRRLNSWWFVSKWPAAADEALVGERVKSHLNEDGHSFDLDFSGRILHLNEVSTVRTGANEEDRIYIPLSSFEAWTGIGPSLLEISVPGSRDQVNAEVAKLQSSLSAMQIRPVHQLLEAQGVVVMRMRSVMLASTLLITLTVALCVFATLTSSVLERRRDFAVMKAIGSSQRAISTLFAGEALSIALFAAVIGYLLGSGLAAWISKANFHTAVAPQLGVLPVVILTSLALALFAAVLPLAQLQRIEPAGILKGE